LTIEAASYSLDFTCGPGLFHEKHRREFTRDSTWCQGYSCVSIQTHFLCCSERPQGRTFRPKSRVGQIKLANLGREMAWMAP